MVVTDVDEWAGKGEVKGSIQNRIPLLANIGQKLASFVLNLSRYVVRSSGFGKRELGLNQRVLTKEKRVLNLVVLINCLFNECTK